MPTKTKTRFVDKGNRLSHFQDKILIRCIRCKTPGTVHAEWKPYSWRATFLCAGCDLSLSSAENDWAGPIEVSGRRPCGYCGHKWLLAQRVLREYPAEVPEAIRVKCPQCDHFTAVKTSPARYFPPDSGADPHFGMPLHLYRTCRHGEIWAYNARHLAEMKGYVQATLRTRVGSGNGAMFSRLPKWMKVAKNRDEVVKQLERLEALVSDI